jgi:thiol-disulfide isomerase/thioredoxin
MRKKSWLILAVLVIFGALFYKYRMPRYVSGEKAPDFEAILANGDRVHLSDLAGKYVLLQFWGSWCGPCRAENPDLGILYRKYNARGFEIFSVGIEKYPQAWKRAMAQDGMTWKYSVSEFKEFDGSLPHLFNIKSIPTTFLINPDRMIIAVNPTPAELDEKLAKALTN